MRESARFYRDILKGRALHGSALQTQFFTGAARKEMNYNVRVATPADASAIQAIYAPMVLDTVISFELIPPTVDEMAARIAATLPTHPYLVAEVDGKVVGYAYASQHLAGEAYGCT